MILIDKKDFIAANIKKGNFLFDMAWNEEYMCRLTDEEYGRIMRSICKYATTMILDKYEDRALDIVLHAIAISIDKRTEAYANRCKSNAINGRKGGFAKAKKLIAEAEIHIEDAGGDSDATD